MSAGKSGVQGITIPRISFTIKQPSRLPDTIGGAGEGQTKKGANAPPSPTHHSVVLPRRPYPPRNTRRDVMHIQRPTFRVSQMMTISCQLRSLAENRGASRLSAMGGKRPLRFGEWRNRIPRNPTPPLGTGNCQRPEIGIQNSPLTPRRSAVSL